MQTRTIWLGEAQCPARTAPVEGDFTLLAGEPYARIANVDRLDPFLMSVVGESDIWLFAGSNGTFTAGRSDPDGAIFPYETADRILRRPDAFGALSVFLVERGGRWSLWEPWQASGRVYRIRRNLYKHIHGTSVLYEEINDDLGLAFRWSLAASEAYGLIRTSSLENTGSEPVTVRYLDGWHRILVPGVGADTYARVSYLVAGYMRHESPPLLPLGVFTMNAAMSDLTDPLESLRASAAWSLGHADPAILLSDRQVEAFRRGEEISPESEVRGEFGGLLVSDRVALAPGASHDWVHAADTRLDHAALVALQDALRQPEELQQAVRESLAESHAGVRRLIAGADGLQHTADASAGAHHFANTLYNVMRGGTFRASYRFPKGDLGAFLTARNRPLAEHHAGWLSSLPDQMTLDDLQGRAADTGDRQLARLAREYLPLTFSRRHGDPSRPWNQFTIRVKDADGRPVYGYQGNWRDIFQNWEALAQSFPRALPAMISVFLDASTADGYNPYRITRDGIDWEVTEPGNMWGHFGYWGDHQIVYLLRLLESAERFHAGCLSEGFREERYSYARVPYEIAGFDGILADPRHTITFNHDLHRRLLSREREEGSDARLLRDANGEVLLVSLAEKLLAPLLSKLSNLVPEGGIWLNTQRPEWNDANNALAGWGLSVVTVQYIRRYLSFLDRILAASGDGPVVLTEPVARFLASVRAALQAAGRHAENGYDDAARFETMEALGRAGEEFRATLYCDGSLPGRTEVSISALRALVAAALPVVDQTIRANRRPDGLYHSYNVLHVPEVGKAALRPLQLMLEGQVAALSAGLLTAGEALEVLTALRASDLYRPDQDSYMLYPDRELTPFLERNTLPEDAGLRAPLLAELVAAKEATLVVTDALGRWHFQAEVRNVSEVSAALDRLSDDERWRAAVERDRSAVLDLWEEIFRHSEFTGRSGTFFMFEGLGSVYWHMVAKLLVATQECWREAVRSGADAETVSALAAAYDEIRDGLGFRKSPVEYGAFPTDPYSHTPKHKGAQQPGMTGQVKEEILTRWGELGVEVEDGRLRFAPRLLHRSEFSPVGGSFQYIDLQGDDQGWDLAANSLAFTCCQVPVCYGLGDSSAIRIEWEDGRGENIASDRLDAVTSAMLFDRTGDIQRLTVTVPAQALRP